MTDEQLVVGKDRIAYHLVKCHVDFPGLDNILLKSLTIL